MYVAELSLTDFRSYREVSLRLVPGINVFIGTNGQGKTNLVEAIHYLATLSSHRVASDQPLVRQGADSATINLAVNEGLAAGEHARELQLKCEIIPGKANRASLNGVPLGRTRELLGVLQTVVFAPEDLALVKGDPAERRRFLDETVTQLNPGFASIRADLDRILRQRNALLKSGYGNRDVDFVRTLDAWDQQLAAAGGQVLSARLALLEQLQQPVADAYTRVSSDRGPITLAYETNVGVEAPADVELCTAAIEAALASHRKNELERGVTLVGPQRDELAIGLRGLPVRGYASHGESWSAALALRLGVFDLLRKHSRHGDPVLILDDVFAELDELRRDRLVAEVHGVEQVIVTAAVRGDVPAALDGALFDVFDGEVNRVA